MKRAVFKHIADAGAPGVHHSGQPADLVVNCTGLSASKLGGVEDKTVVPARGQIVVVRNSAPAMCGTSGTDDGPDEACYIMTRAAGGGTILGGCYQKGNWESQPDPSLAIRIMQRCVDICPELTGGKGIEHLDIIRHGVGLRPVREGGTRIEKETINGVVTVHNYGAGGKFKLACLSVLSSSLCLLLDIDSSCLSKREYVVDIHSFDSWSVTDAKQVQAISLPMAALKRL